MWYFEINEFMKYMILFCSLMGIRRQFYQNVLICDADITNQQTIYKVRLNDLVKTYVNCVCIVPLH